MKDSIKSAFFKPEDGVEFDGANGRWITIEEANARLEREGESIDDDGEIKLMISVTEKASGSNKNWIWYNAKTDIIKEWSYIAHLLLRVYQHDCPHVSFLGVL